MHNNLDKQPVKQNTPIVAIGGCGQGLHIMFIVSLITTFVNEFPKGAVCGCPKKFFPPRKHLVFAPQNQRKNRPNGRQFRL